MRPVQITILWLLPAALLYAQQDIDLSGKITDAANAPVAGAEIKLKNKNLTTTSAADGTYRILWSTNVVNSSANGIRWNKCRVTRTTLHVALARAANCNAGLFDIRGRMLWKLDAPNLSAGSHLLALPLDRIAGQSGVLQVTLDANRYFFRFVHCNGVAVFSNQSQVDPSPAVPVLKNGAISSSPLAVLDTLVATSAGLTANPTIRMFIYMYIDTVDFQLGAVDSFSEARQQCFHRINAFRATLHLKPYLRDVEKEFCADSQARNDCITNTPHGAFDWCISGMSSTAAQNECPGWSKPTMVEAIDNIVIGCMQSMWDEGPGGGHYENMRSTKLTKLACGFYYPPDKKMWACQDFRD